MKQVKRLPVKTWVENGKFTSKAKTLALAFWKVEPNHLHRVETVSRDVKEKVTEIANELELIPGVELRWSQVGHQLTLMFSKKLSKGYGSLYSQYDEMMLDCKKLR